MPSAEIKRQSTDNKLLGKITQKQYWVILVILFTAISLFMAGLLWIFPPNSLGYDLAIGVFTSSVFIILTVVFLSWLLDLREKTEWHAVRDEVLFNIKAELTMLFDLSIEYFKAGPALKIALYAEKDQQKNCALLAKGLEELEHSGIETNNLVVKDFFENSTELQSFLEVDGKIMNIQGLYSKHLPADITVGLMKIQRCIWVLDYVKRMQMGFNNQAMIANPLGKDFSSLFNNYKLELLRLPLTNLIKELHSLYLIQELKFNYPPIVA